MLPPKRFFTVFGQDSLFEIMVVRKICSSVPPRGRVGDAGEPLPSWKTRHLGDFLRPSCHFLTQLAVFCGSGH
jgi:hypothetical protein